MVEDEIYSRLTTYSGTSGIVSNRVYPGDVVPQNPTMDSITYRVIDVNPVKEFLVPACQRQVIAAIHR